MSERRHPLAECEVCPLAKEPNTVYVPSILPEGAKIAFIGEAPGRMEARDGKPFIGPSGKLLDLVLDRHGISRSEVALTNAVSCNKPTGDITPTAAAIRACRPRLVAELESTDVVVPMGNSAALSVLGEVVKITQARIGPSKQGSPIFPDKRIIPTIHPAACLRYGDHFPYLVMDIGKINAENEIRWTEPVYKVWNTHQEVIQGLNALARVCPTGSEVAVDIETGVDKDQDFSHPSEILCVGIAYAQDKVVIIEREALKLPVVKTALTRFLVGRKLICHNGKYDLQVLNNVWNLWDTTDELHLYFDTMLASYALDERPGTNSLDYNGQEILGTPDWKGVISRYISKGESYAKVPVDVLDKYNAYDCAVTWSLYQLFSTALERQGLRDLHDMMIAFSNALAYVEKDGIKVDLKWNQQLFDEYSQILDPLETSLRQWVDNPRSPKQVKEALAKHLGIDVDKIGTTNAEALERYFEVGLARKQEDLTKFCKLMLEYRLEHKRFSTYVKGLRKRTSKDGRIYPTYLIHGTTSGRLSSRNPNIQNQPRYSIIRKQYIPGDGFIFVQGDYAGIENRVVAVESRDEYLLANLDGWNRMVASRLYGEDYTEEQYVRAKAMVHGSNYGREAYSIAVEYDMSESEAQRYLNDYRSMIPDVIQWQQDITRHVLSGKPLQTKFGRKRRYHLITRDNQKDVIKEGLSFIPQSTASDINNNALVQLVDLSYTKYSGVMSVRIPVHDSILCEWREDLLEEGAHVMKEVMERAALLYTDIIPFNVEIEYGHNWGEKEELSL
jgi:uracil-DNA glycosylase family 4